MERKELRVGTDYGWDRYGASSLTKATLLSLEPLQVAYEEQVYEMGKSKRKRASRRAEARELVCLWKDKEEWERKRVEMERGREARNRDRRESQEQEITEMTKQLLMAGYKERLPGGFRAPHGQIRNFSISPEMLKRLLAAHPEFAPLEQGESALAELLGGEDASGASVLPPGSE